MRKNLKRLKYGAASAVLVTAPMALASGGSSSGPFSGDELDAAQGVVTSFLAVGAAIVIALVIYRLGKRAINRV